MDLAEATFAVIIIGVDDDKGGVDHVFSCQHCLAGAPGLGAAFGKLTKVVETKNIIKTAGGAEADGVVLDLGSLVSMNMWGLTPDFLDVLEQGFGEFFQKEVPLNPLKAEYLIPTFIGQLLEQDKLSVKVLRTDDTWYGMTYKEDVPAVKESFREMLEKGMYQEELFADL